MSNDEEFVDVESTRLYMAEKVDPVLQDLIAKLAVSRPAEVLGFIRDYAAERALNEEGEGTAASPNNTARTDETASKSSIPLCCVSGFPAECKVRDRDNNISYYTKDHCDALRRKGRLRWSDAVALDEDFPVREEESETTNEGNAPSDELGLCGDGTALPRERLDERPVTPPRKGFTMTQPGMNFKDGGGPSGGAPAGPAKYVSYKPQALGALPEEAGDDNAGVEMGEDEKRERATRAAERRQQAAPKLGSEHLFSKEKREEMNQKRKRDDMLGVIAAYYGAMGGSAPFGLAAASDETLQKHFAKCQQATLNRRQERSQTADKTDREDAVASVLGLNSKNGNSNSRNANHQHEKQARSFSFEPRALGVTGADGGTEETAVELSAEEKREQVRQAALNRLDRLAGKAA
jgi:hypothetical protein